MKNICNKCGKLILKDIFEIKIIYKKNSYKIFLCDKCKVSYDSVMKKWFSNFIF